MAMQPRRNGGNKGEVMVAIKLKKSGGNKPQK